jgi:hypothetical protein
LYGADVPKNHYLLSTFMQFVNEQKPFYKLKEKKKTTSKEQKGVLEM